ncbi:RNase HI in long-term repeat retroelement DIRS1 family protein, putative, partial [Rhizoctonia solani AG-3 Rhs1AP]
MKERPHAPIYINKPVRVSLEWLADRLRTNKGLSLIRGNNWEDNSADLVLICDACPSGMGFWSPTRNQAFYYRIPPETERSSNFCEAACLLSALGWAVSLRGLPLFPRILIFSDNLDACHVFSTMAGHAPYHSMTLQAAAWLLDYNILLRVKHIVGKENRIADYLSRGMLEQVRQINRSLPIAGFTPLSNVFPGNTELQKPATF